MAPIRGPQESGGPPERFTGWPAGGVFVLNNKSTAVASAEASTLLSTDGVGERLRRYRDADAAGGERGEAVLPLLA